MKLALIVPLLALATFAARATELFVPDLFYARVPDRAAKEDLVSISVEGEAAEGPPGACALSVRSDEDDVRVVVEYAVAVSSGDAPCSVRLSCALEPEEFASIAPGLADLAGRPAPDAAARLRPLLAATDPRLGESLLLLEKAKALFLATLEVPPRHAMRDGNFVPLDPATNEPAASESHAESAEGAEPEPHAESAETIDIPFYYEWANPGTPEEMKTALEPVQRTIDGLDRLVSSSCSIDPSGRADYTVSFSTKDGTETGVRETIRILYEALDNVPVPDGAVLRVPVLVKGVKTPGAPATQSPAEEKHAEAAEAAEPAAPDPHVEVAEP